MSVISLIESLESTTFSGRRFTRRQLEKVIDTIQLFPKLSRKELALTICEHLSWKSPNGSLKVNSAVDFLEKLEELRLVSLPPSRGSGKKAPDKVILTAESEAKNAICRSLSEISPIELHLVETPEERSLWNEFVSRYHYLGYKRPFGSYIRYFVTAKGYNDERIGCLLFSSSAWALSCRDTWIGWKNWHRARRLHLIVSNSRFLIFPWVQVPNLASHILSLIPDRLASDWLQKYAYKPVLIETFVDKEKYAGTIYKAANWQYLGETTGRGRFDETHECKNSIKDVYVYPLQSSFRKVLVNGPRSEKPNTVTARHSDGTFIEFWDKVIHIVNAIAREFDQKWQIRKRLIDSMLLIMLIFRLVSSKNRQGYGTTIDELWDNCRKSGLPLPQKTSIASSSFVVARRKLDESIFQIINSRIVATYETQLGEIYKWQGHRIFAVDGTKINLPRQLIPLGYLIPALKAHYPQGLVSCLYQLHSKIPWDFELTEDDERKSALKHLKALSKNDVVVYDRGYFSFALLFYHQKRNLHAIFRLSEFSYTAIRDFMQSPRVDDIVTIYPSQRSEQRIRQSHPEVPIEPMKLRLIKYIVSDTTYCLGTTLLDQRYQTEAFSEAYHSRWGIEELYKVSKQIFRVEDFHAKTLRGVKQEIYAQFVLITMNRIFANHTDDPGIHKKSSEQSDLEVAIDSVRVNFKNCISAFVRNIEGLFLHHTQNMKQIVSSVASFIARRTQRVRPGRNYVRISMKPRDRWEPKKIGRSRKSFKTKMALEAAA